LNENNYNSSNNNNHKNFNLEILINKEKANSSHAVSETDLLESRNLSSHKEESEKNIFISDEHSEINEFENSNKLLENFDSNYVYNKESINNLSLENERLNNIVNNDIKDFININNQTIFNLNNHNLNSLNQVKENSNLFSQILYKQILYLREEMKRNISDYSIFDRDYNSFVYKNFMNKYFEKINNDITIFNNYLNCDTNNFENILQKQNLFVENIKAENILYIKYLLSLIVSDKI